jgi:hypothetical protein
MQTKLKRHDKVKLLIDPDPEYVEYDVNLSEVDEKTRIKKGMLGKINILLPNGQYHVEVIDDNGETIAYAPMAEEDLELMN